MPMKSIPILRFGLMVFVLASGFQASAQELTKEAKIERILALTKADTMIDQMFNQVKAMTASQVIPGATSEQRATAQEIQDKIMGLMKARMGWDKMRPQYVKLYSDTFSDEEIDGLLVFHQSPAGRAMIEKMPLLMSKIMAMTQAQMGDIMPEIQRITKEALQK